MRARVCAPRSPLMFCPRLRPAAPVAGGPLVGSFWRGSPWSLRGVDRGLEAVFVGHQALAALVICRQCPAKGNI
eukprot:11210988-Lingulodinium_polyedra.AAC.1